jgi:hypothetical protein
MVWWNIQVACVHASLAKDFPQNLTNRPWGEYLTATLQVPGTIVPNKVHAIHGEHIPNAV